MPVLQNVHDIFRFQQNLFRSFYPLTPKRPFVQAHRENYENIPAVGPRVSGVSLV
jgi:hypothetical protein